MSHCQNKNKEDLFRLLRRTDGSVFEESVVKNWYRARKYVLEALDAHDVLDKQIWKRQKVHVVLEGTSELMMSVARQIAFIAHYPTFDEMSGANKTVITILYDKNKFSDLSISDFISREEYLCNLPRYCKYTVYDFGKAETKKTFHSDSYIDIELELVGFEETDFSQYESSDSLRINESCIQDKNVEEAVDVAMAKRVNMVYNVGADVDNLPPNNPYTAERYDKALFYFCYQQSMDDTQKCWECIDESQVGIKNKLSNVFCADCFAARLKYVINANKKKRDEPVDGINLRGVVAREYKKVVGIVKDNVEILAKCEHARWNVEKLLLGFRPLLDEEYLADEQMFGAEKKAYRKQLKKRGIHIDLCSYHDLRRINPGDMKYDCFLMIAVPRIMLERGR